MTSLQLYADFICPFCYVAEMALLPRLESQFQFHFDWQPFELHPETPSGGRTLNGRRSERIWSMARRVVQEWDLPIQRKPPQSLPNTRLTMIAAEAARGAGKLKEFRQAAYNAYFVDGKNIGDRSVLETLTRELDLSDPKWEVAVDQARTDALEKCILAGPAWVIGERVLTGLHDKAVMKKFLGA